MVKCIKIVIYIDLLCRFETKCKRQSKEKMEMVECVPFYKIYLPTYVIVLKTTNIYVL